MGTFSGFSDFAGGMQVWKNGPRSPSQRDGITNLASRDASHDGRKRGASATVLRGSEREAVKKDRTAELAAEADRRAEKRLGPD